MKRITNWFKEYFRKTPKVFFTSDLHFNHTNVITYCNRPFKTREEMNDHIIKVWNKTVKPFDHIFILGDFALNPNRSFEFAKKLNGRKVLVAGNHDACFIGHKKNTKMAKKYEENGFSLVFKHTSPLVLSTGLEVLISHLPYLKEEYDQRYKEFRPMDQGQILLHGHLHGRYIKHNNMIDVSWDAHNGKILTEEEVIAIINDSRTFIKSHLTDFYENRPKDSRESAD